MAITARVRMYNVGELGDCFFLTFKDGKKECNLLIDCGSFRNSAKSKQNLTKIVKHIKSELKEKKLNVVVGTHQHNDHVSGFVHCSKEFDGLIENTWLSWLDNPKDSLAKKISKEQKNLVDNLRLVNNKITELKLKGDFSPLQDTLGFYAATPDGPEIPWQGMQNLKSLPTEVHYLDQGEILSIPGISKLDVKVYVLGPPRNENLLFDKDPKKSETYDPHLWQATEEAGRLFSALTSHSTQKYREENNYPFNSKYKKVKLEIDTEIVKLYDKEQWRNIDSAWLDSANQLALFLDSYTNNCSLVLAFELVKSGRVLLFAADAQTGNWTSWKDIKWDGQKKSFTTYDLLANTVLYKVGHHGSHNATLVEALEAMNHEELVALIPVDKNDPNITKLNGWKMPAKNLFKRLKEKTQNRVLRMDEGFASGCDPVKDKSKSKWKNLPHTPKIQKEGKRIFYVEYIVQG